jgi:hypothetical protein
MHGHMNIMYLYAPAMEAAAPTVYMVWLRANFYGLAPIFHLVVYTSTVL